MCQFLPQDRLEDFSKLDSKGLLLNALQSIGEKKIFLIKQILVFILLVCFILENQDLLNNFNALTELADSMIVFNVDQKTLQNTIKSEISTNSK